MAKFFKTIVTGVSFSLFFYCLGCGPGTTQQTNSSLQSPATPNITQVIPQSIPAGSQSMTIKVTGTNFPAQAAILWNGAPLSTTVVGSNTLSGTVGSSSLVTPTTVQLKVQNTQTMQESAAVPLAITGANSNEAAAALAISIGSLPQGVVGSSYNGTLTIAGGTAPYTWSLSSGQLPPGLSLSAASGAISGTPTSAGNFSFGVTVIDSSSSVQTATTTVSIPVVAATVAPAPLAITTMSIPSGTIGGAYSTLLQSSGGTGPYAWSITSGGLPNGLSLSASTGLISGTPTTIGSTNFTATLADSSNPSQTKSVSLTLVVAPLPLAVTTSSLVSGTVGSNYQSLLQASGGVAPYAWSITGSLPAGLSLAANTGIISGSPTATGTFNFTANVADAENPAQTKSVPLSIVIAPVTLAISTSALPSGTQSSNYSAALQAFGGTGTYTWSIASGTLPAGLSLATTTGVISGTPTASGNSSFKATVTDTGSPAQTATATITISVVAAGTPLAVSTTSLPAGTPNKSYSATLYATGGTSPYSWTITNGALPSGISLNSSTGIISGKTAVTGTTSLTFQVTDSSSTPQTQTATLSLAITPPVLAITTSSLPGGTKGSSYSNLVQASGGTTPYAWSITSGSLPTGLSIDPSSGLISGTPTATGTFKFTATVADAGTPAAQTASVSLSIVVAAAAPQALVITTSSMPAGTNGTSYSSALQASGGTSPYAWSITGGSLPTGLGLNATTGLISGTPTANGTSSFTVTVTDGGSPAQTKSVPLSIVVAAAAPSALTINATLPSGTVGTAYSSPMSATGGTPAYTWSITAGTLPTGLTLAATTGIISGTPSASGTYNFTATVTDNGTPTAQTQSAQTSIVVAPASDPGPTTTWYVRPDGGTRYSSSQTTGQCDGKADAAYGGTGVNQHCAFNDPQFLWQDGTYATSTNNLPAYGWVIAGGDTVIIRGGPWRIGWKNGSSSQDSTTGLYFGLVGDPYDSIMPTIPAGTSSQHTRILGENYGSCSQSNMTQLHGGFGISTVVNLSGAQYVDVQCFEITDYSQCSRTGGTPYPSGCSTSPPLDDYATAGIRTTNTTANILLQDLNIHGIVSYGLFGPIGGPVTMNRVRVAYNAAAGWMFDDGNSTPDAPGSAINASYVTMQWNGCNEEYPIVDTYPAISCYDDVSGGFGDAWSAQGTGAGGQRSQLAMTCDHCILDHNTKDGFGMNHIIFTSLSITNSVAYANMGQQWKWSTSPNATVNFTNNLTLGNCSRMGSPITGAPSTFNTNLSDFCRAGDTIAVGTSDSTTTVIANNTVVSYAPTIFDLGCLDPSCSNGTFTVENNIVMGYDNPGDYSRGLQPGGPGAYYYGSPLGTFVRSNNIYYGVGHGFSCPTGYPNEQCLSPQLVNQPLGNAGNFVESELDNFNFDIAPGSPALGAGISVPGVTLDYTGLTRGNPPSIGAYER